MNAPILILPALAGLMALSAAKTMPADLRHDAQGKTPLIVAKMAVARGAGSTCRLGCNESNVTCAPQFGPDPGTGDPGPILGYSSQTWNPHMECGFSITGSCFNRGDVLCNTINQYSATAACTGEPTGVTKTYTSFCSVFIPE